MTRNAIKRIVPVLAGLGLLSGVCLAGEKLELKSPQEKESYSLGYQFGENLKKQGMGIHLDIYTSGIRDALGGKEPRMSQEEIRATLTKLRQRLWAEQQKALREKAEKNLAEGKAFLAENGKKEGVKTLPSGLQFKILKEGLGRSPKAGDMVSVHYRGTFIDGKEFDSSYKKGKAAELQVDRVIPGWTEALQLMKEGAKWQIFVPSELGYGKRGQGPIPPNSALIFEIELISIK
jgi:FKBP-type peptidyl-prolyl cis-trans isomerase FklB